MKHGWHAIILNKGSSYATKADTDHQYLYFAITVKEIILSDKLGTYSGRKGAGPYPIIQAVKNNMPANWIMPYFIPSLSPLTKLSKKEVIVYVTVSSENIRPI